MANNDLDPNARILVVDDDTFQLTLLETQLKHLGLSTIQLTESGQHALQLLQQPEPYNLIICDLQMPGMDGIELLRHLVEKHYSGGLILLSGESPAILSAARNLATSQGLQVIGSLSKPVTLHALSMLLQRIDVQDHAAKRLPEVTPLRLAAAIGAGELTLHYQPKVRISNLQLYGAECLVRWEDPERGLIPPAAFIPVAEEHGLIDRLTEAVIGMALEQAASWQQQGLELVLSINLSMDNLHQLDLPDRLFTQVLALGLCPTNVALEVTESRLMTDTTVATDILTRLRLRGFPLSIDDFGTGFSSLAQLRQLPFSELKIDRAFVNGAHSDPQRYAILEGSINMAKKLNLSSVAEGVENHQDWATVAALGCDLVQGYYLSRPLNAEAFECWVSGYPATLPREIAVKHPELF